MNHSGELTSYIKEEAIKLGFSAVGIAAVHVLPQNIKSHYLHWLERGYNGEMGYLERNVDKRFNPKELLPECKSIIVTALNYYNDSTPFFNKPHLSTYARGLDYHVVVKDKLHLLLQSINNVCTVSGRVFCDSAPVYEHYWAVQGGIGWIGKNNQLIIPHKGSYFFLGELFLDVELEYDSPFEKSHCGNCELCIAGCPTSALTSIGFDARKCLSYLSIEYRGDVSVHDAEKMGNCFYGCDKCQSVCPHNRFSTVCDEKRLHPGEELMSMNSEDWKNLTSEKYKSLFKNSAVERCGYEKLKNNIDTLLFGK